MRSLRWQIAAVLALLPTVFGQLSPVYAEDSAPTATTYPQVVSNNDLVAGNSVSFTAPDWAGSPTPTQTQQWYSCSTQISSEADTLPTGCTAIAGATNSSLTLTNALKAKFLVVGSFSTNSVTGQTPVTRYSASTVSAVAASPALKATVLGSNSTVKFTQATTATLNSKYTVDVTGWVTAQSYLYKWYRCDGAIAAGLSAPTSCLLIPGAGAASYVVTANDVDRFVTGFVTAKNGTTEVASVRIASANAVMQVPVNSSPATVFNGTIVVGSTLTAMEGSWVASPRPTFTYQWYSCTAPVLAAPLKNAKCLALAGETSANYVVSAAVNNKYLMVQVKATNSTNEGSPVSSYSASTSKVLTPPTNTLQPGITSSQNTANSRPIAGATVTVIAGTWNGSPIPSKTYQWYSCDSSVAAGLNVVPSDCVPIAGATGASIVTNATMHGKFVVVEETASNLAGVAKVLSASTNALQAKPSFGSDPTLSGTAESSGSLTVVSGASDFGGALDESYAWAKCATAQGAASVFPVGCTVLAGETNSSIQLDVALEGYFIVGRVTLTNPAGSTVRTSATSTQITGPITNLQITKPVSSRGYVQLGVSVDANDGQWTGFPKPSFEYVWYRCDSAIANKSTDVPDGCQIIVGAASRSYMPVTADAGKYLSVKVTAVQGSSRIPVWSPTSYQVLETPSFTGSPAVGSQRVVGGANLVPVIGGVRGTSTPRADYLWYRCSAPVAEDSAALAVGCSQIPGATAGSYAFVSADVGKYVLASVTLSNEIGTARRFTSSSQMVNIAPVNLTLQPPVSTSLPATVGTSIRVGANTWSGTPTATISYQWFRCDYQQRAKALDVPSDCVAIGGQTADTYTPTTADSGKFLSVAVRGSNEHGSQTAYSPSTLDIAEPPRFLRGPALNAARNKGASLEVSTLELAGWPTPASTYRWFRCDSIVEAIGSAIPAGCVFISGATASSYKLGALDIQKYVLAEVKIKNSLGEALRYSTSSQQVRQIPEIADTVRISGNQWVDQTLTASGISVAGFPSPITTIQWVRCELAVTDPTSCSVVATGTNTYKLVPADRDNKIAVRVTARNDAGNAIPVVSPFTTGIRMVPKLYGGSYPAVSGLDSDGEARAATIISAFEGVWIASPDVESSGYKYQWYSCTTRHPISTSIIPPDCLAIKNEVSSYYTVKFTEKEKFIGFSLKVSNGTEDVFQFSTTSARVYVVPLYMSGAKPAFTANQSATDGSPRVGYEIEANVGTWQGSPSPTYSYQWFHCTKAVTTATKEFNDLCQDIVGATGRILTIGPELVGKYLGFYVLGKYKTFQDEIYSVTSTKAVVSPPVNTSAPRITTRFTYVQSTLKTTEGTWLGTPEPVQTHNWWVCDQPLLAATAIQPTFCRELENSSGNWKVTADQDGKYLSSLTTSTNTAGVGKMWSATTAQIVTGSVNLNAPNVRIVAPSVPFTGSQFASTLVDLKISDAAAGDWVGDPLPDISANEYSWYRCTNEVKEPSDSLDNSCQLIEINANSQTYRPISEDVGKYLVGAVKNDNGVGASIVYTASSENILQPPNSTIAPSIAGKAFVDQPVTEVVGTWEGLPTPTFKLQWLACESQLLLSTKIQPTNCAAIDKATTATFVPTDDLLTKFLVLRTTATNKVGEQVVWSASTSAVVSGPVKKKDPKFTYPPTVNSPVTRANPIVGSPMTTDGGEWKGVPEPLKSYEWFVCPAAVTASATAPAEDKKCELISGATGDTITPSEGTRGKFLLVHVHAVNENGEADFYSATTTAVWMAPVVDHVVVASGTAFHRLTVKAKQDTWKTFPDVTKTYQWFVCSAPVTRSASTLPDGCTVIDGATSSKYKIPDAPWHIHEYLVVKIRVSNAVNWSEHYSATSEEILTGPVNERTPTITGNTLFTSGTITTLTGNAGVWSPVDSALTYQWYRCDNVLVADDELDPKCVAIQGANALTYQLSEIDPGKSVMLSVTGEKNNLRSTAYSASTVLVTEKVRNVVPPTITGTPRVNEISTGEDGDWRGFPAVTKTRSWYSCTTRLMAPVVSLTPPATCKLLAGAITNELTNDASDIGKYLVYAVSATNKISSSSAATTVKVFSAATEAVADPPVFTDRPELEPPVGSIKSDSPKAGSTWKVRATWVNKVAPTLNYQWYRCETYIDNFAPILTVPDGCAAISAATEIGYLVRVDDQNKYLMVSVTGTNAAGTVTQFTNTTHQVFEAPYADPLPTVSGNHSAGSTLTIDPGVWSAGASARTYNWYRCTQPIPATTSEQPPRVVGGNFCTNIQGNGLTYLVDDLDNGTYITAQVVASNTEGTATTSYLIGVTEGVSQAPENTTAPSVKGDAYLVGLVLTASGDQWAAMPPPTKTYQWYGCTSKVQAFSSTLDSSCEAIPNANSGTYQIERELLSKYILVGVTAQNGAGSATKFSASTNVVEATYEPGGTSVAVAATGGNTQITPDSGVTFSQTNGSWTKANVAVENPSLKLLWLYCSEPVLQATSRFPASCDFIAEGNGTSISASNKTLTLDFDTEFAGYYISSVEYVLRPLSLTKFDAFRIAKSTARVTIAPRIWDDSATFTEPTVTKASIVGTQSSISQVDQWQNDTDSLSPNPLPSVTWRGVEAGTFTYQWFSCVTKQTSMSKTGLPVGCENISGATDATYTPTASEVREYLGAQITATNTAGSASIWTKTSEMVTQRPTIVPGYEPNLNNITMTQDVATVNTGTWQGEPAPTFTYKWMLCGSNAPAQVTSNTTPADCTVIGGANVTATSSSIVVPTLGGKNVDKRLVVQVIATNKPYFASPNTVAETRASASSISLKEKPYFTSTEPVILTSSPTTNIFAANVGETLTMVNDQSKWFATPVEAGGLTFAYSWFTCGLSYQTLQRTETLNSDCTPIANETGKSLVVTRSLSGLRILGKITATSSATGWGALAPVSGYATSATPQIKEKPYSINAPSESVASGAGPQVGVKISGSPGDWGGFPQPQVDANAYQWFMCNDPVPASSTLQTGCTLISTPTSNSSYTPSSAQAGKYIVFSAQVSNTVNGLYIQSTDRQYSAGFGPTLMAPEISFTTPPFTGTPHVGQTLTTTMPTSRAFPAASSTSFEWYHCATNSGVDSNVSVPSTCTKIGDTNQTSITVDESMAGRFIEIYAVSTNTVKSVRKNTFSSKYVTKSPTNDLAPTISGTPVVNGTNKYTATAGHWSAVPSISTYGYTWFLCTSQILVATTTKPSSCASSGVSATTVAPTQLVLNRDMAGKFLVLEESASQFSNNIDSNKMVKIYSASSPEIKSPPLFETSSTISGYRHVDEVLTATIGNISGYPTPIPTIQWYSCTSPVTSSASLVGFGCSPISGADSNTFTATVAEVDRYVTFGVTATNSVSTATNFATSGAQKITRTPTSVTALTIQGDTQVGANKVITATGGTWAGSTPIAKAFNWYYCDTAKTATSEVVGSDCTQVTTPGGLTYVGSSLNLTPDYRGKHIVAVEVASNSTNKPNAGRAQMVSVSIGPINMAPVFDSVPIVSGVAHVGETLTASLPTVSSYPASTRTYEWWSCSAALNSSVSTMPSNCLLLTDLGDADLSVTSAIAGRFIALVVTAVNSYGSVAKSSIATVDVTQSPTNRSGPTISGTALVGSPSPLSVSSGTWTSSPVATASDYSYLWYLCSQSHSLAPNTLPADCAAVTGQTASSVQPTDAMAGKYLLAKVTLTTRTNKVGAGVASVYTSTTDAVRNRPGFNGTAPTISGTVHVGETLSATMLNVTGFEVPTSSYQWWLCNDIVSAGTADITATCSAIDGSADANLVVTEAMAGKRIAVVQTATNNQGSATKSSATTALVSSTPSVNTAPEISGSDIYSSAASSSAVVSTGAWNGFPVPTASNFSYQWYFCPAASQSGSVAPSGCTVVNVTTASVNLTSTMVGKYLVAKVTVTTSTNKIGAGTSTTYSSSFGPIRIAPSNTGAPSFSPTTVVAGRTIAASVGTWSGTGPITTSYKWYSCPTTATISATVPVPSTCSAIAGYDNQNLVVPAAAATKKLLLAVTATNSVGSTVKSVMSSAAVSAATISPLALRAIL
ncbi:MAG: hypothetical protein RLY83_177 [Actinomycetota bacterium]